MESKFEWRGAIVATLIAAALMGGLALMFSA